MSEPKRLRILINGIEVNETPLGWTDITNEINFSNELNTLLETCTAQLTFSSDGYDTLMALYDDGFCSTADIELQEYVNGYYQKFFDGKIFIKSAEIDRAECQIKVTVEDNSYYATINNNRKIEFFPFASQTKNKEDLDPANFTQVIFFDPNDGSTLVQPAPAYSGAAYPIYNLFQYAVSFMTDNRMSFDSVLFGQDGDYEGMTITCGTVLRQYQAGGTVENDFKDNFPKISFEKLFSEVKKNVDIGMYIDFSGSIPVLRIERTSTLRTNATAFRATNILGLKERFDQEKLYGSVRIGSVETTDKSYLLFPNNATVSGWREEQLLVLGECNSSAELNLVNDWIKDHNTIEDCLMYGETDHDKKIIFIMCDVSGGVYPGQVFTAQQGNLENQLATFPVFYNLALNGYSVMDNYLGAIPNAVAQYLGDRSLLFRATNTSDYVLDDYSGSTSELIPFPTDIIDINNLWDGNYYSVTENGIYTFHVALTFLVGQSVLEYELFLDRLDAGLSLISSTLLASDVFAQYEVDPIDVSGSIMAAITDKIRIRLRYSLTTAFRPTPASIQAGALVECTSAPGHGGAYKNFDPDKYPVREHLWEYPLTFLDYKNISRNQTGQIEFSRFNEKQYSGWIKSLKFKRFSDEKAQFITYRAKSIPVASNLPPEIRYVLVTGQLEDNPFIITPDYYGRPTGGGGETVKTFFYLAGGNVTITILPTYLGVPVHPAVNIVITKFTTGVAIPVTQSFLNTTVTFPIEHDSNYIVQLVYSLTEIGETYPSVQPYSTPPATAGANGAANIQLITPNNPADYTFAWSGPGGFTDTAQSIIAPAGNYTCIVTYVPGTFDHNSIIFHIQIPVSETGQ